MSKKSGGDVANPKGAPENLNPVRTKEEAKKRGAAGGKKSGETRRRKRDAKQSISLLLDMPTQGNIDKNLMQLGFVEEDRTNMNALTARMFSKAMSGDVSAYKAIMDYGGHHPDQELRDKERKSRIKAIEESGDFSNPDDDEDTEDVVIYLPSNGKDAPK